VARAEFLPPYSRAAATGLHRLPGTESAVNVAERRPSRMAEKLFAPGERTRGSPVGGGAPREKNNFFGVAEDEPLKIFGSRFLFPDNCPLRRVATAPGAQIHARPSGGAEFNIERRIKHLLQ